MQSFFLGYSSMLILALLGFKEGEVHRSLLNLDSFWGMNRQGMFEELLIVPLRKVFPEVCPSAFSAMEGGVEDHFSDGK